MSVDGVSVPLPPLGMVPAAALRAVEDRLKAALACVPVHVHVHMHVLCACMCALLCVCCVAACAACVALLRDCMCAWLHVRAPVCAAWLHVCVNVYVLQQQLCGCVRVAVCVVFWRGGGTGIGS